MNEPSIERCPVCQYDLTGLPPEHRCPECGFAYDEHTQVWHPQMRLAWLAFMALLAAATLIVCLFVVGTLPRSYLWPQVLVAVGTGCLGAAAAMFSVKARKRRLFAAVAPGGVMARTSSGPMRVEWPDVWPDGEAERNPSASYRRLLAVVKLEVLLSRKEQRFFEETVRASWQRYHDDGSQESEAPQGDATRAAAQAWTANNSGTSPPGS